ncbi:MAG TPA: serine/threonine-protein kinase [Anaeromyxobacter sp.]|nr:serine/threonine-protein kinase [Anaeromyxobacter sp.]
MAWRFPRGAAALDLSPAEAPDQPTHAHPRWELEDGEPIVDGRLALKRLGGGSRYEVFLAWDERLFALVVAKLLRPHVVEDARALRELRREAQVLAQLAHPALVRGFGAVLDGPRPHLVLEHVEGPSLGRLVKRYGALSMEQLLPLALQLASALHYVAAAGHVHLDVKPANVVMGVPPRLIDLSIARTVEDAAALHDAIGTDGYMAPEQCAPARFPGRVGPPADVFGLGATLYHAAAGEVPFPRPREARTSSDPAVRFPQLAARAKPLPSHLPESFRAIVAQTLAPDPADRPTAAEVAAALEPLVADVPTRPVIRKRGGLPLARRHRLR